MLDLVPFTLDQVFAVKMGDGLTWGVQGGGSISASWESSVILVYCVGADCLRRGSSGSEQSRFRYGDLITTFFLTESFPSLFR